MSLRNKAVSGVKWTSVSAVVSSIIQLLQVAILTRFLDKDDFGLMALAIFVIGISRIFIDMGISNAIIHKQQINKYQLSTLFWINILLGGVIFLIVILISPWIAQFYGSTELEGVVDWTAVSFLILPWGQQFDALLKKDFRFKSLAVRDVAAKLLGFVVAVLLAYLGFGVYSLVFANLAAATVSAILLLYLGLKDYRPQFLFSLRSLRNKGFYSFGLFQMGEKLINYFNANFDTILIGKILGMEALGLYNIAKTLAIKPYQVINPIITKVAFPAFSKVQNDTPRLKNAYLKVVGMLTSLNGPVYLLMIVVAYPLVQLVFGSDWIDAAPILQLLAVGALCNSIGNPIGSLQLAKGRADWGFYWNLGLFVLMPVTIWLGGFFGLIGVAFALAVFKIVVTYVPSWYFFVRPLCRARYGEYLWSFSRPLLLAVFSAILPYLFLKIGLTTNVYVLLLFGALLYGAGYLVLSFIFNKKEILETIETINLKPLNKLRYYLN